MIFGKGYDESLWVMMSSDKRNRERIAHFIMSIPGELYRQIQEKMDLVQKYIAAKVPYYFRDEKHLHGNFETEDGVLYWFRIDPYNRGINLGCESLDNEKFEMTIYPRKNLDCMEFFDSMVIGSIEYDMSLQQKTVNYELIKTSLGLITVISPCKMRMINIRNMPEELFVTDMVDSSRVNKLVRGSRTRKYR